MTSEILQFVDFTKTQKSKYLENKTLFFLQIKKFHNYTLSATLWPKKNKKTTTTDGIVKNKKRLFPSHIKSPIFNTNAKNIKLQMLLEGLKSKQLEENTVYIIQRELQINNHKVDNGLNEAVIRDN